MNENEKMELRDEQLEQVSGGAINVYDAGAYHTEYWKYTCVWYFCRNELLAGTL